MRYSAPKTSTRAPRRPLTARTRLAGAARSLAEEEDLRSSEACFLGSPVLGSNLEEIMEFISALEWSTTTSSACSAPAPSPPLLAPERACGWGWVGVGKVG